MQKKIALINDVTGFGRCSIAVMAPIVSAMKIQAVTVPTAILSAHTQFPTFYFDDYTDKMEDYIQTYKELNLEFDAISTGFLGSERQVEIVTDFIKYFKNDRNFVIVDPVMGDYGRLYQTYNKAMCNRMKELVKTLNEASKAYYAENRELMSNFEYDRLYDELEELDEAMALKNISHMPARVKCAVLRWHTMEEMLKTEKE